MSLRNLVLESKDVQLYRIKTGASMKGYGVRWGNLMISVYHNM